MPNLLNKKDFNSNYWVFIIQNMNYPEMKYDHDGEQIACPDFIPFRDLALEVIFDLERKQDDVRKCQVCGQYFDVHMEEGIVADPDNPDKFICSACSRKISARECYEKYMEL